MKMNEKNAVDRGFAKLSKSLEKAARRQEQLDLLVEFCGDDQSEFEEALALLEARWRDEDGLKDSAKPMTTSLDSDHIDDDDDEFDAAVATLMSMVLEAEHSSPTPTPAALAEAHENIYDFAAYDPAELKHRQLRSVNIQEFSAIRKAEDSDPKLAMGLRAGDETSPKFWRLAEGNDLIKARDDRHRADFTWVGKGLEAEGVRLFVDGVRIEDVEVVLRADTNAMRLFFVLPDHIGDDVPLDRAETCLEDDGSVRVQLWTKN
ncbi:MAG: hypothetical protein AAGI03_07780 [Pseudomonadota bacterium]